jgi:SPP1 gp7 family putative phage head morphogenesis protein
MAVDKFIAGANEFEIVHRSESRSLLPVEHIQAGQERIAAGENPDVVAFELAVQETILKASMTPDEPRTLKASAYPLHDAADAMVPKFMVLLKAAFQAAGRHGFNEDKVVVSLEHALKQVLPRLLLETLVEGGKATVLPVSRSLAKFRTLKKKQESGFRFSGASPEAEAWAEDHAGELIKGITETTRDQIRFVVSRLEGADITSKEALAAIADAIGDEERARTIARTETMRAVHQGQQEAWDQAVEDGYLTGKEKRVWIVTPDDKLCPICDELDGEEARLGKDYPGGIDGPPAHPNCRCTEGLA